MGDDRPVVATEPRAAVLCGLLVVVLLSGVWAWWAAKEGAYFGAVMYPGVIVLCAALLLIPSWRGHVYLRHALPARIALVSLLALGAWSAISALWSPTPDVAIADAQRILGYGLAFGLGLWLTALLGRRSALGLVPLAVAGLFAGALALVAMLSGSDLGTYLDLGTLQYPIGYRNATAAFFLIAMWPALGLATTRELPWPLRGVALGTATLCVELAMLSQSRGSVIGAAFALVVYLAVSRERARSVGWLVLAVVPALIVVPALTDLYETARELGNAQVLSELRAAGRAALLGSVVAAALGGIVALAGRRTTLSERARTGANRAVGAVAVGLAIAGLVGFVVATGDPADWIGDRVDEFRSEGTPDTSEASSRFGVNAGSERYDLWRVALKDGAARPVLGEGGGGYQYSYLRQRTEGGVESVRDAHSVELEIFSELGLVGVALFVLAVGAAAVGALRASSLGPGAAAVSCFALAAAAYWLAHASLDWFWTYPAVTAPVFALLGCAQGAFLAERADPGRWSWRPVAAVAAALLALSVVPPFLSQRYLADAYAGWRDDPERAARDLDRAETLNPASVEPLLAAGAIARASGDRERAIAAFESAVEERPQEWAAHYFLATLYQRSSVDRARQELRLALELNPLSPRLEALREKLSEAGQGSADAQGAP